MCTDAYYMDPLTMVDNIVRERKLAIQGIYTWLPQFLVRDNTVYTSLIRVVALADTVDLDDS